MNHQMPVSTEQTTPKVTARALLEELSETVLEFSVDVEEGREEAEEVDDDVSFASRTVYLENNLKFAKDVEKKKCIHQGIQDGKSLTGRYWN